MMTTPGISSKRGLLPGGLPSVGLCCSFLAAIVATLLGVYAIPQFASFYASTGATLPLVTRLFARFYMASWVAPVAVIAAWRFWPVASQANMVAGVIGLGALLLVVPTTIFAAYLAIFGLGAAI